MKTKILICADALYGGGAEKVLQILLQNLDYEKYELSLLSIHEEKLNENYPQYIKYNFIFSHPNGSILSRFVSKFSNKLKLLVYYHFRPEIFYKFFVKGKYDVEIAFIEGYATRLISGSNNVNSKKMAWVHTDLINNPWTNVAYRSKTEEKNCYGKFDIVIGVSQCVRESFCALFPNIKKSKVLYNPIDQCRIKSLSQLKVEDRMYSTGMNLISIGRLESQKGYDRLLPILKILKEEGFYYHLSILGEGSQRAFLEKYIYENELDNVSLLGYKDNPYPYLRESDLFVCSSRSEGYSTVVTEALILGIPVISTDCSGMRELLGGEEEYGMIVENNDKALYQGLKSLLESNDKIELLKKKAEKRSLDFSLRNLVNSIEREIELKYES